MNNQSIASENGTDKAAAPSGQRRQVTVLFADMVGYMPLAEQLGEEKTYLFMQRVHRELSEAIHAEKGTVQEITGDGVMALFGAPVALEDAPIRACRAALDIQARIANIGSKIEAEHGARPAFRIGLHSGPLIIGAVGDDQKMELTALGDTVNFASRIESVAENGTVAMSKATHSLVADYVDCHYEGEREIKGRSEQQKLWRLDAVKQGVRRFDVSRAHGLTPLVGRLRELDTMEEQWRLASTGQIRLVSLSGEAGIGKSRLLHEFRGRLGESAFILEGYCAAEGQNSAFLPFADVVRRSFGFAVGADNQEARRRLRRGLEYLGLEPDEHLPFLLNLLGYDDGGGTRVNVADEARGIRTRDAVIAMLNERCRLTPTVLFIEDLHWMDHGSRALLSRIISSDDKLPLLIVTTQRPGYQPPWSGNSRCREIPLQPLSDTATRDLLKARLDVSDLPQELAQLVGEKAQGNPLFAEEITNYLLQSGSLTDGDNGLIFSKIGQKTVLPVGLANMLMERFDRLEPAPRRVLEAAAVLGQRFETKLVAEITGLGDGITIHLAALEDNELIFREQGQAAYRFKNALVHDAVYEAMLSDRRGDLHDAAGLAIETAKGPEAADALAHHFSRTNRTDKAIRYLALAGENSLRIYSLDEAAVHLEAALALAEQYPGAVDDGGLTDILLQITRIKYFKMEFFALIELVQKYLPRVEALADKKRLSRFLFEGGYAHVFACQIDEGRKLLAQARALGEEIGDEVAIAYADLGSMWDRMFWGQPGEERHAAQREAGERIMAVGRKHGDVWLASKGGLALGIDLSHWGRPGEGREVLMRLMAMSRESNDPRPRTMALWALSQNDLSSGNYTEAIENADEALSVSISPIDTVSAKSSKVIGLILTGAVEDALTEEMELPVVEDLGLSMSIAQYKMIRGIGTILSGDMARGFREIEAAARQADGWGQTMVRPVGDHFTGLTYLQMATAKEKPPLSVMLKNLPFLLRTLPFVKQKARRHLQAGLDKYRWCENSGGMAQCLNSLGRLDVAEKRFVDAKTSLQEARDLARSVDLTNVANEAEAALSNLPTN